MKYLIIVNPISGRGYAGKSIPLIEDLMRRHNLDFDLVQTERPWHAADIAERAVRDGYAVIVTASGDGTANEALNGIMRAKNAGHYDTAMSILPVGTGNDMAYGMGLRGGLEETVQALAKNHRKRIDIGLVKGGDYPEGRYFANGIGIGFDAMVGFEAIKVRWTRGLPAYLIGVIRTVFWYFKAPTVEMKFNGKTIVQPSLMISVMNGQRMGGGFYMAPDGDPGDGRFDLCIASEASRLRIFGLIPYFLKGTQHTQPEVTTGQTDAIRIKAVKGSLPAHADGEMLCVEGQELHVELIPSALEFVTMEQ